MARRSEGLTEQLHGRVQPDEAQMLRDIAAQLGTSQNRALRWLLRYGWQHATSTTDHSTCPDHSPCAIATQGLRPGKAAHGSRVPNGQQIITHEATVENSR